MTGPREDILLQTASTLLNARRNNAPIAGLPDAQIPSDIPEVYRVQDAIAAYLGPVGGWKVGAPTPEATPVFAPMPSAWIAPSGSTLSGDRWRYRGLEAEIAFLVGHDLPPRLAAQGQAPYTRDEVLAAMASCHPAIEVLESAFLDPTQVPKFAALADLQMHGGFVYGPAFGSPALGGQAFGGPAVPDWRTLDFNAETVTLSVDGILRVDRTGSNTSGDLLKLLPWLANEGAARTGGLRAGQWITTGSWTGNTLATTGSVVEVHFATAGNVNLRFA